MTGRSSRTSEPNNPVSLFKTHGGQLRLSEALALGLNRYQFYKMRDEGVIEPVSRGLYRLADLSPVRDPDLAAAASRFPNAVLCLVSALAWHDLTTQIPRRVDLAVERNARLPKQRNPPVRGYRFSGKRFTSGIERHQMDGIELKVYNPEKTLADCFAYRNNLGQDIVLEATKLYVKRGHPDFSKLLEYARICRVEKVMRPYLQSWLLWRD